MTRSGLALRLLVPLLISLASLSALSPALAPGPAPSFTRLSFQEGTETVAGKLRLQLGEPDNAEHPQLWQGPLSITRGASRCLVDASLIRDVYLSRSGRMIVVVGISGSDTLIHFFATANCAPTWPGIKAFTRGVHIEGNRLLLLPACECGDKGEPCSCSSGSVYLLAGSKPPLRLAAASRTLTRNELGVSFNGTRIFAHPPPRYVP